jgi:DNA-binding MarR family transcriptional regulator
MPAEAAPSFDPLIANAARLRILGALARADAPDFVSLRQITQLTDGNLVTHARRLSAAGLVAVHKLTRGDGRIITTYHLTAAGREALEHHARQLQSLLVEPIASAVVLDHDDDDWID